jgi:hypothetical protein
MCNKLETAPEAPTCKGKCCHYWIIETPEGPTSKGVCQFCGAEKEFDSFGPDSWSRWERDTSTPAKFSGSGLPDVAPASEQDDS